MGNHKDALLIIYFILLSIMHFVKFETYNMHWSFLGKAVGKKLHINIPDDDGYGLAFFGFTHKIDKHKCFQ